MHLFSNFFFPFIGLGLGAQLVSGMADAHQQALRAGFPDTIDTYGLVSGSSYTTFLC